MSQKNLHKEDRDWLLFLLLEGELDGTEKEDVLERIDKDPEWKNEWQLMQKSVLPSDTSIALSIKEKNRLKKSHARILPIRLNSAWLAYAAAASAVLAAFWLWRTDEPVSEERVVDIPEQVTPSMKPHSSESPNEENPKLEKQGKVDQPLVAKKAVKSSSQDSLEKNNPSVQETFGIAHDYELLALEQQHTINLKQDGDTYEMPSPLITKMTFRSHSINKLDSWAFSAFEWANNAKRLWSAVQDPELSFSRVKTKGGQGLAINFRSEGYETTTQLIVKNEFIQNFKTK